MISPEDRKVYIEALRPPEGYHLDRAIGTTYSLDLLSLLMIPMSFTKFNCTDAEKSIADPITLLESLHRNAHKVTLFCQKGAIAVPAKCSRLYSFLESMVHQVSPDKGVFHPKVWVVRYVPQSDKQGSQELAVVYRLICLSRNLTFDRSWDIILSTEGAVTGHYVGKNRPIGDFLNGVAFIAGADAELTDEIIKIADEVRHVEFDIPDGFKEIVSFNPLGIDGYKRAPINYDSKRMLIISPFVDSDFLKGLCNLTNEPYLVSRAESVDNLDIDVKELFENIYVLNSAADDNSESGIEDVKTIETLSGLHAKAYILEKGWDSYIWVGSANATRAAFTKNIEFIVQLKASKAKFGIDILLKKEEGHFGELLSEYTSSESEPPDPILVQIEELKDILTSAAFRLTVGSGAVGYDLKLSTSATIRIQPEVKVFCWPITLPISKCLEYLGSDILFKDLVAEDLTGFIGFEVMAASDDKKVRRFVLNLPIEGAPADRLDRIFARIVTDKNSFLRYLYFLLTEDEYVITEAFGEHRVSREAWVEGFGLAASMPLFEDLVRAYSRDRNKLERIKELVMKISATTNGVDVFPDGFLDVWQPIIKAMELEAIEQVG